MIQILQASLSNVFLVGDSHGQYDLLCNSLQQVGFDPDAGHVLVSVGDLIDRGPDSIKMLQLLEKPWFYAVMGNHERMLLDSLKTENESCFTDRWNWQKMNGGDWFRFDSEEHREVQRLLPIIESLPLALEIKSDQGSIGVIHASVPKNHWPTVSDLADPEIRKQVLWSRKRGQLAQKIAAQRYDADEHIPDSHVEEAIADFPEISGIDWVVVGHTIMPNGEPVQLSNVLFLDVGAAKGTPPKVVSATALPEQNYLLR